MRRKRGRPLDGWLIIDKPPGMTSTDVVNRVRRGFDAQKAGHGGTLDPLATGVLPIAFGAATKTVPYVMDGTKLYRFTLALGEARDTDDADGRVTATSPVRPTDEALRAALPALTGDIMQVPPVYSALKVAGAAVWSAGEPAAPDADSLVLDDEDLGNYRHLLLRDGRLVGAVLLGETGDAPWYLGLIRGGADVSALRHALPFGPAFAEAAP